MACGARPLLRRLESVAVEVRLGSGAVQALPGTDQVAMGPPGAPMLEQ